MKKTILFTMPAIMAGCGQRARYVITDKGDNAIVYNQVSPVADTTRHVMIFDQETMDLYKYLSVGDTIDGSDEITRPYTQAYWPGSKPYVIDNVNGEHTSCFIERAKENGERDKIIRVIRKMVTRQR